jgi:UDP-N-acetylglucosamine 4-epimerase
LTEKKQKNLIIYTGGFRVSYKHLEFDRDSIFLVTGGAGFIGSNLCEALLNMGYQVRCMDNFSTGKRENIEGFLHNKNFTLIEDDIRNYEACMVACAGADYVLHQAAWGSVPRSIEMPLLYEEINIRGTLNMMEAARQQGVKKFVYASSSSVYGDHPVLPKKEGQEGELLSPYALTKRVDEEYGKLYTRLYGLDTYGLRYFNVFGRRQDPDGAYAAVIPKFIKQLLNDEQPTINGDGKQSRDFTYIENVIEANLKACLASSEVAGQAFNIAYGGREYLIDIYYELCKALGKDIEPIFGPDRPGDIKHSNADISKARELLGYEPEWSFERGIEAAIEWYRENL